MFLPQRQLGSDSSNGAFNGSFLVLNLGANTIELGSAFGVQSFPPISIETTSNSYVLPTFPISGNRSNFNQQGVDNIPVASNARENGSVAAVKCRRNEVLAERKEENSGRQSNSASRKRRPAPSHLQPKDSVGVDSGMTEFGSSTLQPSQLSQNNARCNSSGGGNATGLSRWGPPPEYLVNLLNFFGWKVEFRHGFQDYVYISPGGVCYLSLPKAFETFLHNTNKCKGKEFCSFQSMGSINISRYPMHGTLTFASGVDPQNGGSIKDEIMRKRESKMRSNLLTEADLPVGSSENPILLSEITNRENGNTSSMLEGGVSQGVLVEDTQDRVKSYVENESQDGAVKLLQSRRRSTMADCRGGNSNMNLHEKSLRTRRSVRLSQKYLPIESKVDLEVEANDKCESLSEENEEEMTTSTSDSEYVLDATSESSSEDGYRKTGAKISDRKGLTISKDNQIGNHGLQLNRKLPRTRRSVNIDREHVFADAKVYMGAGSSRFVLPKSIFSTATRNNKEEQTFTDNKLDDLENEKIGSRGIRPSRTRGTKQFDLCNMASAGVSNVNLSGSLLRVRRSMRINGKHVPVDLGLDVDMERGDSVDIMKYITEEARRNKDKSLSTSTYEDEHMNGRIRTTDKSLLSGITVKGIDSLKINDQKLFESNGRKKAGRAQNPVSASAPLEIGKKFLVSEVQSPATASKRKPAACGKPNGKKKKKRNGACSLVVRRKGEENFYEDNSVQTKANILSWLIDTGTLNENEKIMNKMRNDRGNHLRGLVTRGGILCSCCKKVMTLLEFEAHNGSKTCQPLHNVCLVSGKSLMQCLIDSWKKEKANKKVGFQIVGLGDPDPSDDTCGICADGGHLICCDSCPSTFHQDCLLLKALPEGSWYCPHCMCKFCKMARHGSDRSNGTFTLYTCNQCGRKYHLDCAWENGMHEMVELSLMFCGRNCRKVEAELSNMLSVANPLQEGFSWTLLRRDDDDRLNCDQRLYSIIECNAKLSLALSILDECFNPLIDPRTGLDMLSQAVYNCGSNFKRLNYEGFYTAILEKNEEIVSVASLRIHGGRLAEMPFIGTRPMYRWKGMCRLLLGAIEEMLSSLHVEKLIIPAIPDFLDTWMTSFSFKPLDVPLKEEIRDLSIMVFAETTLLQKAITAGKGINNGQDELADNVQKHCGNQINCDGCIIFSEDHQTRTVCDSEKYKQPELHYSRLMSREQHSGSRVGVLDALISDEFLKAHPQKKQYSLSGKILFPITKQEAKQGTQATANQCCTKQGHAQMGTRNFLG